MDDQYLFIRVGLSHKFPGSDELEDKFPMRIETTTTFIHLFILKIINNTLSFHVLTQS